ncbi:MAG TPA: cation-efflux pump [Xanthobacteraceae bacterium]|nr:cation-efflux pump [Xanthobacteraceae bacterium]
MNEKEKAALGSIAASAGLTAAKGIIGVLTGSLAILSEAGHSLLDLSATVLTYFAVRVSGKPADEEHQYGHGKVESVTALAETALLFLLTAIVVFEAVRRLIGAQAHAVEATVAAFAIIVGSIVIDFFRARRLKRVAQATGSEALEADALHFRSDMWSSIAVLIGLFGVALGHAWADAAAALVVAVFICIAGYRLGRRTIDTLTDTAPAGVSERVAALARQIPGVVAVERVRVRPAGAVLFVELTVSISRALPLDRVTTIKQQLTGAIRGDLPAAELTITTEPRALDDETVRERVMVIARDLGLAIHHVAVQTIAGRLSVSVDLEVDGSQPLAVAHEVASRLEEAIRRELGPDVEVETHIEPLPADLLSGRDADPARILEVRGLLSLLAAELPALGEVHDVRVRETAAGEIVNFHCVVDPALSVSAVHDRVDALERRLRRQFPTIQRVIGHAEPRRDG